MTYPRIYMQGNAKKNAFLSLGIAEAATDAKVVSTMAESPAGD
jgi:hypothetical protein